MTTPATPAELLCTSAGEVPLQQCRLHVGGRDWSVLHTGAILTHADEARFLGEQSAPLPYGVALWPSAIALAHEVATRAEEFRGRSVLELGAGTGLPGIVAASLGARVVQTDRHEVPMHVCRRNADRNVGGTSIEHRIADWTEWADVGRYDWVIGSDILYVADLHWHLRRIFEMNLTPSGRLLLADPFRPTSLHLLEELEAAGWKVTMSRWSIGEEGAARPVGVFELVPPGGAGA